MSVRDMVQTVSRFPSFENVFWCAIFINLARHRLSYKWQNEKSVLSWFSKSGSQIEL